MPKRSKVSVYEQIRKVHEREGASIRELSRRFGVHRRDVRQALESAVPPARKPAGPRSAPVLDAWKPLIDRWLEEDKRAPRKQRHTARRVWQRLVEEHRAQVGESTVRRYVSEVRARQEFPLVEVAVPQHHPLGEEAEVDFGDITVYVDGMLVELKLFIMRLSASGRGFARAYLNEAQEVFLDGHVRAFEHFGGAPARIRYDNLKAAVARVLKGRDRLESDRFIALRSHYGFDSFFCQPGPEGAHEKGGVEGEVGRFIHARRLTVGEHFALEAATLRPLPGERFDFAAVASHRVDRKSRVSVRGCTYSVPARYAGRRLDVRVGAETIEVFDGSRRVATHARGLKGDEILVLDHYLEVLAHKPGALPGATALARARSSGAFGAVHERYWAEARRRLGDRDGTKALIEVLLLHRVLPAGAVTSGMDAAVAAGTVDPAVVAIEARRANEPSAPAVAIGEGFSRFDRPAPTIGHYDQLLEGSA
jgi:transposase